MDNSAADNIAAVLALIVAVALALSAALGQLVTYLTEAIKATGLIPKGFSGLVAMGVGVTLGMLLGGLADAMAEESYGLVVMLGLGAFAGALMAAGGIQSHKAMGEVNQRVERVNSLPVADDELVEAVTLLRDLKSERERARVTEL